MAGMVYQGYASYLQAYQRHTGSYCSPAAPFSFNPYDKKYRFPDVCSTTGLESGLAQNFSTPVASSSVSSENSAASGSGAVAPTTVTAGAQSCVSPTSQGQLSDGNSKSEEKSEEEYAEGFYSPKKTTYLSTNCVLLTYFSGDLASAVDEHFTRALSQNYSQESKGSYPMSQRNLPPSFWNSNHQATPAYPVHAGTIGHESLYPDYSGFHGFPQPDPWAYNLTATQQYSHHHRAVSDFTYMPSSSRYPHNYSSLLMSRPRLPQCVVGKSDPWSTSSRLHDDVTLDTPTYSHHFQAMTGLEAAGSSQDHGSKDMYWF